MDTAHPPVSVFSSHEQKEAEGLAETVPAGALDGHQQQAGCCPSWGRVTIGWAPAYGEARGNGWWVGGRLATRLASLRLLRLRRDCLFDSEKPIVDPSSRFRAAHLPSVYTGMFIELVEIRTFRFIVLGAKPARTRTKRVN